MLTKMSVLLISTLLLLSLWYSDAQLDPVQHAALMTVYTALGATRLDCATRMIVSPVARLRQLESLSSIQSH
jgi:hypothetical protein